jgi:alanine dehydrogenase
MRKEVGEKRDFLPNFVGRLVKENTCVFLEEGYGSGIGYTQDDYLEVAGSLQFIPHEEVYRQDLVLELRCPSDQEISLMHPGACLVSMLHYPTRPMRTEMLRSLSLEAISLDSIKDDLGQRLVENLRAVAWNGMQAAINILKVNYPYPGFFHPDRPSLRVTLMGAGAVGSHVVQAAIHYSDENLRHDLARKGIPGVQLTVLDYDVPPHFHIMGDILKSTDILVDATQRPDPSQPVIPNDWIAWLPEHAVILDLSVDPYDCTTIPNYVKGIEGIPQGSLDQYIFAPDDPAYDTVPECVNSLHRRYVASCYSWPGVHPKECMQVYGHQLRPIFRTLIEKGGVSNIDPNGNFFERAVARAQLSRWHNSNGNG